METQKDLTVINIQTSPIKGVTIYNLGAIIQRSIKLDVHEIGMKQFQLAGFCEECDLESIRLAGNNDEISIQLNISDVLKYNRLDHQAEIPEESHILLQQFTELNNKKLRLELEISSLEEKKRFLFQSLSKHISKAQNPIVSCHVTNYLEIYTNETEKIDSSIHAKSVLLNELNLDLYKVYDRLRLLIKHYDGLSTLDFLKNSLSQTFALNHLYFKTIPCITVLAFIKVNHEVELTLTYSTTRSVSWQPQYDIYQNVSTSKMKVVYYACIRQLTGESWSNTHLKLSTSCINESKQFPSLDKEIVSLQTRGTTSGPTRKMLTTTALVSSTRSLYKSVPSSSDVLKEQDSDEEGIEEGVEGVEESSDGLYYTTKSRHTIYSNNSVHRVQIGEFDAENTSVYISIPKKTLKVFLFTKTRNTSNLYLLPSSNVNVYVDEKYVGQTVFVDRILPGGIFFLSLTVNPNIIVKYSAETITNKTTGLITAKASRTYQQSASITCLYNEASVPIAVIFSYPKSVDAKISSEIKHPTAFTSIEKSSDCEAIFEIIENSVKERRYILNETTNHIIDIIPTTTLKEIVGNEKGLHWNSSCVYVIEYPSDGAIHISKSDD